MELIVINTSIISICNVLSSSMMLLSKYIINNISDIFLDKINKREAVDRKLTEHDKYYIMIFAPFLEEINFGMILYCKNKHHKLIITIISVLSILFYESKCSILTVILNVSVYNNFIKNYKIAKLSYSLLFGIAHSDGSIKGSIYGCLVYFFPNLISQFINQYCGVP